MKNEIYDVDRIYWFISKTDKDGKINSVAVPFFRDENDQYYCLLVGAKNEPVAKERITTRLNIEENRNNFKFAGDMKAVMATLVHLNFFKALFPIDIQKKQNATLSDVLRTKILFEKSVDKWERAMFKDRAL